jgi:[FeFe] hydrogenase H-cluster maturation GTPase HydF
MRKCDIAILAIDTSLGLCSEDEALLSELGSRDIPTVTVFNKCDKNDAVPEGAVAVSAKSGKGIAELKEAICALARGEEEQKHLVGDLIDPGDSVILVVPIDSAAPKGRLILPQQQAIRDILEHGGMSLTVRKTELRRALDSLKAPPAMVITDSQVFSYVDKITPREVPLTSFSILMARYKGFLEAAVRGVRAVDSLCDGDTVLISEGCTHHRQCDDIGTVKIPRLLRAYTKKNILIEASSGSDFPDDIKKYAMVIHCGGCMLNGRELRYRMRRAEDEGVPFTNYGVLIAYLNGILRRSVEIFPDISALLERGGKADE